jgi:hypothetical protein
MAAKILGKSTQDFERFLVDRIDGDAGGMFDGVSSSLHVDMNKSSSTSRNIVREASQSGGDIDICSASSFNYSYLSKRGLKRPLRIINGRNGLGMKLPGPSFTVRDVSKIIGEKFPVHVIDVKEQSELTGWTLGKWADYYHTPRDQRKRVLNLISLEFSGTPLMDYVRSPRVVRQVDWIDRIWPGKRRERGEYPQVQYYCLMSAAGSWTDFHLDFGGTSVWYHIHTGRKLFIFLPPTEDNLQKYESWSTSPHQASTFFPDKCAAGEAFYVVLEVGQTMLIPGGWLHAVYTPVDSLVFGGNFLHGLDIQTQLRIYDTESSTGVKRKYRFPYYEQLLWYAASYYCLFTKTSLTSLSSFRKLVKTIEHDKDDSSQEVSSLLNTLSLSVHEVRGMKILIRKLKSFKLSLTSPFKLPVKVSLSPETAISSVAIPSVQSTATTVEDVAPPSPPPPPSIQKPTFKLKLKFGGSTTTLTSSSSSLTTSSSALPVPPPSTLSTSPTQVINVAPSLQTTFPKVKGAIEGGNKGVKEDPFPLSEAALEAAHMAGFPKINDLLTHLSYAFNCDSDNGSDDTTPVPIVNGEDNAEEKIILPIHSVETSCRKANFARFSLTSYKKGSLYFHHPPLTLEGIQASYRQERLLRESGRSNEAEADVPSCAFGLYGGSFPAFEGEDDNEVVEIVNKQQKRKGGIVDDEESISGGSSITTSNKVVLKKKETKETKGMNGIKEDKEDHDDNGEEEDEDDIVKPGQKRKREDINVVVNEEKDMKEDTEKKEGKEDKEEGKKEVLDSDDDDEHVPLKRIRHAGDTTNDVTSHVRKVEMDKTTKKSKKKEEKAKKKRVMKDLFAEDEEDDEDEDDDDDDDDIDDEDEIDEEGQSEIEEEEEDVEEEDEVEEEEEDSEINLKKHLIRLPIIAPVSSATTASTTTIRSVPPPVSNLSGSYKQPTPTTSSSSSMFSQQATIGDKPKAKQPITQPIAPSNSMSAAQRLKANLALARKRAKS